MLVNVKDYEDKDAVLRVVDYIISLPENLAVLNKHCHPSNIMSTNRAENFWEVHGTHPEDAFITIEDYVSINPTTGNIDGFFQVVYMNDPHHQLGVKYVVDASLFRNPDCTSWYSFGKDIRRFYDMIIDESYFVWIQVPYHERSAETPKGLSNVLDYYGGVVDERVTTSLQRDGITRRIDVWRILTPKGAAAGLTL